MNHNVQNIWKTFNDEDKNIPSPQFLKNRPLSLSVLRCYGIVQLTHNELELASAVSSDVKIAISNSDLNTP